MGSFKKPNPGMFGPRQLKEMRDELDRGNVAQESKTDREHRALNILAREMSQPADASDLKADIPRQ